MKLLVFALVVFTLTLPFAQARKPAVEDFVGIESETPDVTPQGTEALFNFEQEVTAHSERPVQPVIRYAETSKTQSSSQWPLSAWFGIATVLGLPFATWLLTMRHLKKAQTTATTTAPAAETLPNNVTALPVRARTEEKSDIKKAS
jgi:hypothetical protein